MAAYSSLARLGVQLCCSMLAPGEVLGLLCVRACVRDNPLPCAVPALLHRFSGGAWAVHRVFFELRSGRE